MEKIAEIFTKKKYPVQMGPTTIEHIYLENYYQMSIV